MHICNFSKSNFKLEIDNSFMDFIRITWVYTRIALKLTYFKTTRYLKWITLKTLEFNETKIYNKMLIFITGILLYTPIFCLLSTSFNYIETANLLTKPLSNVKIPTSLPWWMWFRLIMGLEWFLTQIPARALPLISLSSYCPYIKSQNFDTL